MNTSANVDVRAKAMSYGLRMWEVAEELGILDSALSRKLRRELPEEEKRKIYDAIDRIVARR